MATSLSTELPKNVQPKQTSRIAPERTRQSQHPGYFQEGRSLTAALLALIYLLLALSLNAANWVDDMSLLLPVVGGAMLMGTLMAFSRFDGLFMLSHSLSTGLAWVFFLMTRMVGGEPRVALFVEHGVPELQARAYFLLERWLGWMQAALSNSASNDNYVFVFEISFLLWWLAYLGAWTIFRHGYVWRGVVMAGVALLVNTYYAPEPVTGFLVAFCITALLLLAWTNLVVHRQRWRAFRIHFSQDIGFDFMRTGVIYTIVIISIAFIAPSLGRSLPLYEVLRPVNQRWQQTTNEWNRLYQGLNRQTRPVAAGFGRTLTLGGERNVGNRVVFQVAAPIGRYWRAVTFDTFTGRQWINTATIEKDYQAEEPIDEPDWASRESLTQTVTLVSSTGNVIFGTPDIYQVSVPVAGLFAPVVTPDPASDEERVTELTWARAQTLFKKGDSYTVVSNYTAVTQRDLRQASQEYPQEILDRYLQLPEDFSPRVAELAKRVTADASSTYEKVKALESYLRGFEYDDKIPAPGPDQDPVEYFLFDIKRGYCDYYATAMAVMLRSLGIPARTASGYAEGTLDEESGVYLITERDAHTWVEVYFPQLGWIEFEPTAGESVLVRPSGEEQSDAQRDFPSTANGATDPSLSEMEDQLNSELGPVDLADQMPAGGGRFQPRPVWIALGVLLMLAVLGAGWWMIWGRPTYGPDAFEAELPALFYERVSAWTRRLGVALQPAQTPYERAAVLGQSLPLGRPFIQRITEIYVQHRYGRRRALAGGADDRELDENWRRLRPILWKAWLKRLARRSLRRSPNPSETGD